MGWCCAHIFFDLAPPYHPTVSAHFSTYGLPRRDRGGALDDEKVALDDEKVLILMAGQAGFEPATLGFGVRCSSQLELLTLREAILI